MTRKKRLILFLACLLLFTLLTPLVLLYNQGYRFNFQKRQFTQTGGLFVKASPKQAEIYINRKLAKNTDFFFGSALIENLLPQEYKIEIKKDNYFPWQKTLQIKEKQVTEVKNVILFPEKISFNVIASNTHQFWLSPDFKKIILEKEDKNGWFLEIYDLDKNTSSRFIGQKDVSSRTADLTDLEFSDNSNLDLKIKIAGQFTYFSLKIDANPPALTEITIPSLLNNAITYQKIKNDFYYLDKLGYVYKGDLSLTQKQRINDNPFPIKAKLTYNLKILQNIFFLQEGRSLYRLNTDTKSFERFFEGINDLKISPDSKKIAYFSDSEIWVFFLQDSDPEKKAGDRSFLTRLSEKIDNLSWVGSNYLIFNTGDNVKIMEIDDRDNINSVSLGRFKNPQIIWNQNSDKAYILSEGNLYQSEQLIQ